MGVSEVYLRYLCYPFGDKSVNGMYVCNHIKIINTTQKNRQVPPNSFLNIFDSHTHTYLVQTK
jgi:hypothetical protein